MTSETYPRVRQLIATYLRIPIEQVDVDSSLEELGLDSMGALELIFEIEEEFKILVPNERAAEFSSVRAVCNGIESLQKVSAPAN